MQQRRTEKDDSELVRTVLEAHGMGFQQSVLATSEALWKSKESKWIFEAAEFPVEVNGAPTHVDFVLSHPNRKTFLVCECKKADPKSTAWCFFHAAYTVRDADMEGATCEHLYFAGSGRDDSETVLRRSYGARIQAPVTVCHFGLAIDNRMVLEKLVGNSKRVIEEASAQALRGVNGLVEHFRRVRTPQRMDLTLRLIPVIFTTARLLVSDIDLAKSDLATGQLPVERLDLRPVPWLLYQYNVSPGIKHELSWTRADPETFVPYGDMGTHHTLHEALDISRDMKHEFIRTIAVVSAEAIPRFLGNGWLD